MRLEHFNKSKQLGLRDTLYDGQRFLSDSSCQKLTDLYAAVSHPHNSLNDHRMMITTKCNLSCFCLTVPLDANFATGRASAICPIFDRFLTHKFCLFSKLWDLICPLSQRVFSIFPLYDLIQQNQAHALIAPKQPCGSGLLTQAFWLPWTPPDLCSGRWEIICFCKCNLSGASPAACYK